MAIISHEWLLPCECEVPVLPLLCQWWWWWVKLCSLDWTGFRFGNLPGIRTRHNGKASEGRTDAPDQPSHTRWTELPLCTWSDLLPLRLNDRPVHISMIPDSLRCVTGNTLRIFHGTLVNDRGACLPDCETCWPTIFRTDLPARGRTYDDDKVILSPCNWLNLFRRVILHHHHLLRNLCHQSPTTPADANRNETLMKESGAPRNGFAYFI